MRNLTKLPAIFGILGINFKESLLRNPLKSSKSKNKRGKNKKKEASMSAGKKSMNDS